MEIFSSHIDSIENQKIKEEPMPRAGDVPPFAFSTHNVPSTANPLGVKGAGEAAPSARRRRSSTLSSTLSTVVLNCATSICQRRRAVYGKHSTEYTRGPTQALYHFMGPEVAGSQSGGNGSGISMIVTSTNSGIRSGDNQSDHFIEHPRRCGSSAKDRPKPTIIGFCCNSATAKDFPSSGAILG